MIKATVFIPTYNGEKYLRQIIDAVEAQDVDFAFELLIIDSGSKDDTLAIIKDAQTRYENIVFRQISNKDFGHGKTRNLAAELAKGEIVIYITHDAIPAHDRWLYEMVRPFELNNKIAGVIGKQIPRSNCIPMLKSEINGVFSGFGPDFGTTVFYKDTFVNSQGLYDAVTFYSDANSAARKSLLTSSMPYKDVDYAEDQLFGRDVIDEGYYKAYAPRASVIHSNDLLLKEYRSRMFDETYGLRRIGVLVNVPSKKAIIKLSVRGIIRDSFRICKDRDYSLKRKLYWLVVNPLFYIEKWRGVRAGATADLDDQNIRQKYSLENAKKQN